MLRVLMILEDYGELMFLQTVLKKLGFDVDSSQNPRGFQDHVMTMNPDILVMTASGKKVNGVDLSRGLKRRNGSPKVVLIRSASQQPDPTAVCEGYLEAPVAALSLLHEIARIGGLDKQVLTEKFQKLRMQEIEDEKARVLRVVEGDGAVMNKGEGTGNFGSSLAASTMAQNERSERYKKYLEQPPPKEHGFATKLVTDQVKALRMKENQADLADLERERKLFVEHLFKKKA